MTTRRTRVLGLAFFGGCLLGAGIYEAAYANTPTVNPTCAGFSFTVTAEDGTNVNVTRNGVELMDRDVTVFGTPVAGMFPSPDQTVAQTWRLTITGHNGVSGGTYTVPACVAATTVPPTTAPTTVPTTTPSTTVAVTTPPVPTTVVQPPRVTTTTVPPVFVLPETGGTTPGLPAWALGALAAGTGAVLAARRRQGRAS